MPVELEEMNKEKLYIQNKDTYEINEEKVNIYIKAILNVLRRVKDKDNRTTIVAKNREHLDQLIQYVQEFLKRNLYTQGIFSLISEISKNTIILDKVLDLNFIDVSNVTDMSNLFANLDISPFPEKGWFCKIKLDISKWNRSKVTDC